MKPVYAIKDRALDNFGETLTMPSDQHAIRWFTDLVNADPAQSAIAKHPDDYDLYRIGDYDEEAGRLMPNERPLLAARGKDRIIPKTN